MAIQLKQELRLSQQLVMTPQLQQAIKLLQLNRLELVGLVQQELQENPVLEETMEEDDSSRSGTETPGSESQVETPPEAAMEPAEQSTDREPTDAQKIADVDWQNYMDAYPQTGLYAGREGDDDRPSLESTLTRRTSLADHLEWQLQLSGIDEAAREAASHIIGNIDEDGYLEASLEELIDQCGLPEESIKVAIDAVRSMDPTGVASNDLRECLLMQAQVLGIEHPLVLQILDTQLELLQKRDFRGVAKALGVTVTDVATAAKIIGRLEPKPGRAFGGDDPIYITPDIYVYKIGEDFHILLNEDGLPKLRISNLYREMLSKPDVDSKVTKEYVQDKVRSAMWLIKSIHQRQRTIYKVMQSILSHQRDFFDKGINHLKPLNLRDVADDIEMHESTVSRVTTNKYVQIPQGIFELKFFFNSSINQFSGDAVASESVKERIRKIIENEDPRRPLSDQRIAEMLKSANIDIARRTVTKYREALNLLSSTKRRQLG